MKTERIIVSVTHNGYVVENPAGADYGRYPDHKHSWTFESMKDLQRRLPEILEVPHEDRDEEQPRGKVSNQK